MMRATVTCENPVCSQVNIPMTVDLPVWGPSFREAQKEGGRRPFYCLPEQIYCGCGFIPLMNLVLDPANALVMDEVPNA